MAKEELKKVVETEEEEEMTEEEVKVKEALGEKKEEDKPKKDPWYVRTGRFLGRNFVPFLTGAAVTGCAWLVSSLFGGGDDDSDEEVKTIEETADNNED